jgi:hypothetical protein
MQMWTADLLSGLRDGSKSVVKHLILGPSDFSEPGGQKTQKPGVRRSPASADSGNAPSHLGDVLLVAPLGDQNGAMIGGRVLF